MFDKGDGKMKEHEKYELSLGGEVLYHNDFEGMIKKYSEEKTPQN